jgi:hypothetical protein
MSIDSNPNLDYQWASQSLTVEPNNSANKTEPLSRMKTEGWQWKEKPSYSRLNMWMYRVYTQLKWASDSIDTLATLLDFVVEEDTTYYVSTSGDDDTGDGSEASPWATPTKAYDYMSSRLVPNSVSVTISVAAGEYTFTEPLDIGHPSGDRVFLVGADLSGNKPYGMQIADYSVDRDNPTIPTQGTDEFFNTAGTLPANSAAGTRTTARGNDLTNNEALLRSRYTTIFKFQGCSGIIIETGSGNIDNICIIGDRSTGYQGLSCGGDPEQFEDNTLTYGGHLSCGNNVAVHGFYYGVVANVNSSILCHTLTCTGSSGLGFISQYGGALVGHGINVQGSDVDGINCGMGGSMTIPGAISSGNAHHGLVVYGSIRHFADTSYPEGLVVSCNGRHGIRTIGSAASTEGSYSTTSGNGGMGLVTDRGGSILFEANCYVTGNNNAGALTTEGNISVAGPTSYCQNNGNGGLVALAGIIRAVGLNIGTDNDTWTTTGGTNAGTAAVIYAEGSGFINIQNAGSGNTEAGTTINPTYGTSGNGAALVAYVSNPNLNTG